MEISSTTTAAIGSQLWVVNTGSSPVNLSDLTVRYYLTKEVSATLMNTINWANEGPIPGPNTNWPTSKVSLTVLPLSPPVPSADTYVEFGFTGSDVLLAGHRVQFSWTVQNFQSQFFNQTGDYSFNSAATSQMDWQNVVLLFQGQSVVWGNEP